MILRSRYLAVQLMIYKITFKLKISSMKNNYLIPNIEQYVHELDKNKIADSYKVALFNLFKVHWRFLVVPS